MMDASLISDGSFNLWRQVGFLNENKLFAIFIWKDVRSSVCLYTRLFVAAPVLHQTFSNQYPHLSYTNNSSRISSYAF